VTAVVHAQAIPGGPVRGARSQDRENRFQSCDA